ncbi:hypothetical protein NDU88_006126 [Pleurodeles waltl]|uniref:Uncharacterized protein n=1 Tax=Pleurodeles waltl TaxID=8319 RepID=A0AAV7WCI8_PLEWA|nr:hypothetical protein NDU88_006126 [Pleurodeles waltl]
MAGDLVMHAQTSPEHGSRKRTRRPAGALSPINVPTPQQLEQRQLSALLGGEVCLQENICQKIKACITTLAVKGAYRHAEDRQNTAAAAEFRHSYYDPHLGIR